MANGMGIRRGMIRWYIKEGIMGAIAEINLPKG